MMLEKGTTLNKLLHNAVLGYTIYHWKFSIYVKYE